MIQCKISNITQLIVTVWSKLLSSLILSIICGMAIRLTQEVELRYDY
jgi:hypothetical protein